MRNNYVIRTKVTVSPMHSTSCVIGTKVTVPTRLQKMHAFNYVFENNAVIHVGPDFLGAVYTL